MNDLPTADEWAAARLGELSGTPAVALDLLQGLLPLAVAKVVELTRPEEWSVRMDRLRLIRQRWAAEGRESFDEHLFYRGPKGSETKRAFVDLAVMLAVFGFLPGGVRAFGLHWESQ